MYHITHEQSADAPAIETLLDQCFGPERHTKTVYKVRQYTVPIDDLCYVAKVGGKLLAAIKYWPLLVGGKTPAILLGPIAVHPDHQGEGMGIALISHTLKRAKELGHKLVILVGDPDYYKRFGFVSAFDNGLLMPGPVDVHRFLVCELEPGALVGAKGSIDGVKNKTRQPAR